MLTLAAAFTTLGYCVGATVLLSEAQRRRLNTQGMALVAACGLVGGLFSAKLAHWALAEPSLWRDQPWVLFDPRYGGRTILAGLLGGWMSVAWAKRRLGIARSTGDLWALAVPAGEAVGRLGCLLAGCCYGRPCELPWAVWQHGEWRHPTQIYAGLWAAVTYALLYWRREKVTYEGDLWSGYLVAAGLGRVALEQWRAPQSGTAGQAAAVWVGWCLACAGVVSWLLRRRRH